MAKRLQLAGSPDIFNPETGAVLSEQEAQAEGLFGPQGLSPDVEVRKEARPGVRAEADFARLRGQALTPDELATLGFRPPPASSASPLRIDVPNVIDVEEIRKNFEGGITRNDITRLLDDLRSSEQRKLALLKPTERERQLQEQIGAFTTSAELGIADIEGRARPLAINVGEAAQLAKQAQARLGGFQRSLELEQEGRKTELAAEQLTAEGINQRFQILQQSEQQLQQREQLIQQQVDRLTDNARQAFSTIMENFKGVGFDELDPQTRTQLATLARNIGLPEGVLKAGMNTQKDQLRLAREQQQLETGLAREKFEFDKVISKEELALKKREVDIKAREAGFGGAGGVVTPTSNVPGGANADTGALVDAFNNLSVRFTKDQRTQAVKTFNALAQRGDVAGLKEFMIGAISASLPAEQQSRVLGRFEAIAALEDIERGLNEYRAAGGNTGLLTGSVEQIENKLGRTKDPKLAEIGNTIRLAIVDYRRAVSGAAFTESEAAEYNRLFPSIGKVKELNDAKISSLRSSFHRNNRVLVQTAIGPGNYEKVFKEQQKKTEAPKNVKIGGREVQVGSVIINSKGQRAKVNADGTVTPL